GMCGIKSFASIINEPQGAIMSVGAGEKRPVVRDGQLAIATVMSITLTCDHRVVDGATGARYLAAFRAMIEEPLTMLEGSPSIGSRSSNREAKPLIFYDFDAQGLDGQPAALADANGQGLRSVNTASK